MRKSLIVLLLAAVLCAGGVLCAHAGVDAARDAVTLDETVLYGDKAALEGLSLRVRTQCGSHLFWDTAYLPGAEPEIGTTFAFSQRRRPEEQRYRYNGVRQSNTLQFSASSTGDLDMEDMFGLGDVLSDVASRTEPGATHREMVHLRDYYEYFPLDLQVSLPGISYRRSQGEVNRGTQEELVIQALEDFFRFPVPEELLVDIRVEKNASGGVSAVEVNAQEGADLELIPHMESLVTDTDCYIYFPGSAEKKVSLPEGCGIYRLPYAVEKGRTFVDVDALRMAFPLEHGVYMDALEVSKDESELFLITVEDEKYVLTVIDIPTMQEKQRLELFDVAAESAQYLLYQGDDFLVFCSGEEALVLVEQLPDGSYSIALSLPEGSAKLPERYRAPSIDWDGSKLAWAGFQIYENFYREKCGFYLQVYDGTGLLFSGRYDSSLDDPEPAEYSALRCSPMDVDPLIVSWG